MSFCPRCGLSISPGASFCPGCGESLRPGIAPASAPAAPTIAAPTPPARQRPVGVTIVGVLLIILGGTFALGAFVALMFVMVGASFAGAFMESWMPWMGSLGAVFAIIALVVMLFALAAAGFAIASGIGCLGGRPWAWVTTLIVLALMALNGLGELASRSVDGVLAIAAAGLVGWYFFTPEVKAWFGRP